MVKYRKLFAISKTNTYLCKIIIKRTRIIKERKRKMASIERFDLVLEEMLTTYENKNSDYGNSFSDTIKEFGYIPAVARINDKLNRIKNMVKGKDMNIKESMRDNLLDIATYCVMTIVEIDNGVNFDSNGLLRDEPISCPKRGKRPLRTHENGLK